MELPADVNRDALVVRELPREQVPLHVALGLAHG
jgi:hypothetical protein